MTKALLPVVGLVKSILISVPLAPGYILTLVVPSLNLSLSKEVLSNSSPLSVRKPLSLPSVFTYLLIGKAAVESSFLSTSIASCEEVIEIELKASFNTSATLFPAGSLLPLLPATLRVLILLSINHCLNCFTLGLRIKGLPHSLALLSVAILPALSASVAKYTVPSEFLTLSSVLPV